MLCITLLFVVTEDQKMIRIESLRRSTRRLFAIILLWSGLLSHLSPIVVKWKDSLRGGRVGEKCWDWKLMRPTQDLFNYYHHTQPQSLLIYYCYYYDDFCCHCCCFCCYYWYEDCATKNEKQQQTGLRRLLNRAKLVKSGLIGHLRIIIAVGLLAHWLGLKPNVESNKPSSICFCRN